ncbi:MAG: alpha/beta hydrolase fold domain-containing protein [Planctomycetota bacterium]
MNGSNSAGFLCFRRFAAIFAVAFLAVGPVYRAPAQQSQDVGDRIRIFDGKAKTIIVNGYSTSFKWPRLLQAKLDEFTGGERVLTVKPATKGGTPIARWMDIETGKPKKPWLDILRPRIQEGDEPVIVLAQQSLQWCFGQRTEGIRDANDTERIKRGADVLEEYVGLLKEDGADLVFVAMHIYKHPMEPEIGNERLALAELLKRKIPNVHAGPDVWKPTKAYYPEAFAGDKVHPNDEGAEVMVRKWFETLLRHDFPPPRPARRPGETTLRYFKRIMEELSKEESATQDESDQTALKAYFPRKPGETTAAYHKRLDDFRTEVEAARRPGETTAQCAKRLAAERRPRTMSTARRPGETTAEYTKRLAQERAARRRAAGGESEKTPVRKYTARRPGETTAEYTKRISAHRKMDQAVAEGEAGNDANEENRSRVPGMSTAVYTKRLAEQRKAQERRNRANPSTHKDIEYVPNGHERQKLDIYLPENRGEEPLPLIIWVHGGAWRAGSKQNCPAKRFVSKGYAVASINYRLSQHAIFPAQIEDCKAAVRYLRANATKYGFDPDRFGVWGSSAGGHLVALLGTTGEVKEFDKGTNPQVCSRVQAVCDYFGPTDFTRMSSFRSRMDHDASDSPESKLIGGAIQENKDKCMRANPITYVSKDDPPFLIVHGDKDPLVPHNQSVILHEALQKAGVKVKFHTVPGGGHGGFRDPAIDEMVDEFFEKTLKSAPKAGR